MSMLRAGSTAYKVSQIVLKVMGISPESIPTGTDVPLLAIGVTSLTAAIIVARIRAEFGHDLPVTSLMVDGVTCSTIVKWIEDAKAEEQRREANDTNYDDLKYEKLIEMSPSYQVFVQTFMFGEFPLWLSLAARDSAGMSFIYTKVQGENGQPVRLDLLRRALKLVQEKFEILRLRTVTAPGPLGWIGALETNLAKIVPASMMPVPPIIRVPAEVMEDYSRLRSAAGAELRKERNWVVALVPEVTDDLNTAKEAIVFFHHGCYDAQAAILMENELSSTYRKLENSSPSEAPFSVPLSKVIRAPTRADYLKAIQGIPVATPLTHAYYMIAGLPKSPEFSLHLAAKHHQRIGVISFDPMGERDSVIASIISAYYHAIAELNPTIDATKTRNVSWYSQGLYPTQGKAGNNIVMQYESMDLEAFNLIASSHETARASAVKSFNKKSKAIWDTPTSSFLGLWRHATGRKVEESMTGFCPLRGSLELVIRTCDETAMLPANKNKPLEEWGKEEWLRWQPWYTELTPREFNGLYIFGGKVQMDVVLEAGVILLHWSLCEVGPNDSIKLLQEKVGPIIDSGFPKIIRENYGFKLDIFN